MTSVCSNLWAGVLLVCAISLASPAHALSCDQQHPAVLHNAAKAYQAEITSAAVNNRVNPNLIKAVITAESCFRPYVSSHKGAVGLMQLMPATAMRFGVMDRFDPYDNIQGGARYLRWLLDRYNGSIPHAVAAYNAGEGRVDVYGVQVPFQETRDYTRKVLNAFGKLTPRQPRHGRVPAVQAAATTPVVERVPASPIPLFIVGGNAKPAQQPVVIRAVATQVSRTEKPRNDRWGWDF